MTRMPSLGRVMTIVIAWLLIAPGLSAAVMASTFATSPPASRIALDTSSTFEDSHRLNAAAMAKTASGCSSFSCGMLVALVVDKGAHEHGLHRSQRLKGIELRTSGMWTDGGTTGMVKTQTRFYMPGAGRLIR